MNQDELKKIKSEAWKKENIVNDVGYSVGFSRGFDAGVEVPQKELDEAVEVIKKLSKAGDGTHKDKKASYYDCLPTLQLEFEERLELAREFLAKAKRG